MSLRYGVIMSCVKIGVARPTAALAFTVRWPAALFYGPPIIIFITLFNQRLGERNIHLFFFFSCVRARRGTRTNVHFMYYVTRAQAMMTKCVQKNRAHASSYNTILKCRGKRLNRLIVYGSRRARYSKAVAYHFRFITFFTYLPTYLPKYKLYYHDVIIIIIMFNSLYLERV